MVVQRQPGFLAPGHADAGHGAVQVGQQLSSAAQQFRAGLGELDAAPGPPEQLHVQLAFYPRDGVRQPRLGDIQAGGCAAEMQLLGQDGEIPQIAELNLCGPRARLVAGPARHAPPESCGLCSAYRAGGRHAPFLLLGIATWRAVIPAAYRPRTDIYWMNGRAAVYVQTVSDSGSNHA
jgi:hypothetical protein